MRVFLILFPAILMAQTPPPAAKAAPAAPKAAATKSATPAAKSATPATSAKSAKAKAAAPAAAPGALTTDDQKTIYALGLSMAQQLSQMGITPAEYKIGRAHV